MKYFLLYLFIKHKTSHVNSVKYSCLDQSPQFSEKKLFYQAPNIVVNPPKEIRGQDSATFQRLGMVAPRRSNLSEVSFSLCESDLRSSNTRERWPLWRAQLCRPRLRLLCRDMLSSPPPRYVGEFTI